MRERYSAEKKGPSKYTIEKNRSAAEDLGIDFNHAENEEYALAKSHCLRRMDRLILKNQSGEIIWDQKAYEFAEKEAVPDSVNPSLWINCRSLYESGIYSVVGKEIVQVRGFDLANIAFVRSKNGWIVLDAGSTVEGSRAALEATEEVLGEEIRHHIRAVIISHSHGDHFGGIAGIVKPDEVGPESEGKIPIYAASGFDQATMDEYVYVGAAMKRRGCYQVGSKLKAGAEGKVSVGCGMDQVNGTTSYIKPTHYIAEDVTKNIDGITVDFQITNETEAVANMQNYFHEYRALWVADNCIGAMHNIYTMRGAKIRDAKLWAEALYDADCRYGEEAKVIFQGHAWPHWKTESHPDAVREVLLSHAAAYQFIHDQSLLYIQQGDTADEIGQRLKVPQALAHKWYLRPYYGAYDINARAVYHKYLGFYGGNPVHLHPLTEIENARKFVEYVGSEEAVLQKAAKDFEEGNYQYAAQAANMVVFANPDNLQARYLCADALEQLGYQSESAIGRNAYLTGALELRKKEKGTIGQSGDVATFLNSMDNQQLMDYLGMAIDGNQIENLQENFLLRIVSSENPLQTEEETGRAVYFGGQARLLDIYLVQFYSGALLKKRLSAGESEQYRRGADGKRIPVVTVTREGILDLLRRKEDAWKHFETEHPDFWKSVSDSIVDLAVYRNFNIVEP